MRRKLLPALLGVAAMLAAAIGGTLAAWTSQASNQNNKFTTGTMNLKIQRDDGDAPEDARIFYTAANVDPTDPGWVPPAGNDEMNANGYWYPGKTLNRTMVIRNTGSLKFNADKIRLHITNPMPANVVESAKLKKLLENMYFQMTNSSNTFTLITKKSFWDCADINPAIGATGWCDFEHDLIIASPGNHPAKMTVGMETTADNDTQGYAGTKALKLDFIVHVTQYP